jgi:hypothetical protein
MTAKNPPASMAIAHAAADAWRSVIDTCCT